MYKEKEKQKRTQQVKRVCWKWRANAVRRKKLGGELEEEEERIRDKQAEHTSVPSQHCWGGCNFTLCQVHNQSPGVHVCARWSAVRGGVGRGVHQMKR